MALDISLAGEKEVEIQIIIFLGFDTETFRR
jgi:hypothetical protein